MNVMKKLFYVFAVILLYPYSGLSDVYYNFDGTWQLNNADSYFGGNLEIFNCTDTKCDFTLQSWYDQHICDTNGQMELKSPTIGVYKTKRYMYDPTNDLDYSVPVGINFELISDNGLHLSYTTSDSHSAFCGMSATLEGMWHKSKN